MDILFTYLFKAAISLALFYLLYRGALKNDTFFKLKRFYLLFAVLFSFGFPAFNIELGQNVAEVDIPVYWMEIVDFTITPDDAVVTNSIDWHNLIFIMFFVGSGILFIRFSIQLMSLCSVLRRQKETDKYVETTELPTFSFFKFIVINTNELSDSEISDIFSHEQAHVEQWHSVDNILYELVSICMWWNPFVWLLKKEMKLNLEYLADESVQNIKKNKANYSYLLLKINVNTGLAFVNNFNVSQLKKRIIMMNKSRTSSIMKLKALLMIPLVSFIFLGNALYASTDFIEENIQKIENIIAPEVNSDVDEVVVGYAAPNVAQDKPESKKEIVQFTAPQIKNHDSSKNEPFVTVEQMPEFEGGVSKLMEFLTSNIRYPSDAAQGGVEGRVIVRFVVNKEGGIQDVTIVRSLYPSCDNEAKRVVNLMPKWKPGKQGGKPVSVYYTLPISFNLQKDIKKESTINLSDGNVIFMTNDGKELSAQEVKDIDTKNIEKIEVLKDNAKTKYTSKECDGVVVITLK